MDGLCVLLAGVTIYVALGEHTRGEARPSCKTDDIDGCVIQRALLAMLKRHDGVHNNHDETG